jgi:hypothetical protein
MKITPLLCVLFIAMGGCKEHVPAAATPQPVRLLSKYSPGDDLQILIDDLGLSYDQARYRSRSGGVTSMVYFLDEGNLHIEASRNEQSRYILLATPFIEPLRQPASERMKQWDAAVEHPVERLPRSKQ